VTGFAQLHPAVQHHIVNSLQWRELRPLQEQSIDPILGGKNVLLIAPTAGGKTEAAIFPILSNLLAAQVAAPSVLYVCPLRALLNNLDQRLSYYARLIGRSCALWHGDVTQAAKSRILRQPPDILLTTPESIEAILISTRVSAPAFFSRVRYIVLDELHAFASDDRGWHVWYLLKRLSALTEKPFQIVALSATVGNPHQLLSWICAHSDREQQVIAPETAGAVNPEVAIDYVGSIENAAHVISLMHRGEKRLVFCDSRSQAEQLASHLRTREVETFVSHSSLSKDERTRAETAFAEGRNCVIVATSTLELGIDVGDLDRVIQIDAPSTVASFLQRLGRTGRRAGTTRNCLFLATNSESLIRAAAIEHLWRCGWVEPLQPPPVPFHVATQQALCLTLQNGFVSQKDLLGFVSQDALNHLFGKQFLALDGPAVMIGPETERLYGKRNYLELLSVFDTPPLFLVEFSGREVGWIHELSLERRRDGSDPVILLGGRAWWVRSVNWERKTVSVEPSDMEGRSLWLGSSAPLSFELCQAMRQVLNSESVSKSWSRRAQSELASFRGKHITDTSGTVLQPTKTGCVWWTFAGLRANAFLARNLNARFDNLRFLCDYSPFELSKAVRSEMSTEIHLPEKFSLPKFAEALSESERSTYAQQRLYDRSSARKILAMPMVQVEL
jgi:ATP-dependent Lhr-like helicase